MAKRSVQTTLFGTVVPERRYFVFCLLDCIFMFVIDFMLNFAQKNCLTFGGGGGGGGVET